MLKFSDADGDLIIVDPDIAPVAVITPRPVIYGAPSDHRGEWKLGSQITLASGATFTVAETVREVNDIIASYNKGYSPDA